MVVRSIFIISIGAPDKVLYSRKFPTVEKLAQRYHESSYVPIPSEKEFAQKLLVSLKLDEASAFHSWRDDCKKEIKLPVVEIPTEKGILKPIIVLEQYGVFFCCLTLEKSQLQEDTPLIHMPSISLGFSILLNMINYLGPNVSLLKTNSQKFMELETYINFAMPFGRPTDSIPDNLFQLSSQPWKMTLPQGKPTITIEIMEQIRCVQHGQLENPQQDLFGTITLKAEVEEFYNTLELKIVDEISGQNLDFQALVYHPCIRSNTAINDKSYTLNFQNQSQPLTLFHYVAAPLPNPPITGVFKMREKESSTIDLQLQLFLDKNVRNSFELLEARIPFFNRGLIEFADCKPTGGTVSFMDGKSGLIWKLESSFPAKSLELCLTAVVKFNDKDSVSMFQESFCFGNNSYAQLSIKQSGTLSGCKVILNQMSPSSKTRFLLHSEVRSMDYKIWNECGQIPFPKLLD